MITKNSPAYEVTIIISVWSIVTGHDNNVKHTSNLAHYIMASIYFF